MGLLAWEAEGNGGDSAQALNLRLWGFLEAAKSVLGGGPSQEVGLGAKQQNPPSFCLAHYTSSAQAGQGAGRGPGEGLCCLNCVLADRTGWILLWTEFTCNPNPTDDGIRRWGFGRC